MGLGGAGCGAGAGGTLDRANAESPCFCDTFEPRQNVSQCAHVGRLFLHPDDLACVGMLRDGGGNLHAWQGVKLVEKENSCFCVLSAALVVSQFVSAFSPAAPDSPHFVS